MGQERDKPQALRRVAVPLAHGAAIAPAVQVALDATAHAVRGQQEAAADAVDDLRSGPLTGGREISFAFSGAGTVDTAHKLGRKWSRWIVVNKNATADIWAPAAQTDRTKFLTLEADAAVDIKVVVL